MPKPVLSLVSNENSVTEPASDEKRACVIQVGSRVIGVLDDPERAGQVCADLLEQGIFATWSLWTVNSLQSVSITFGASR